MSGLKFIFFSLVFIALVSCVALFSTRAKAPAIPQADYAGTESCIRPECHPKEYESVKGSVHQGLLDQGQPDRKGCESCHGRGGQHVQNPKNPDLILSFKRLSPKEASEICISCHNTGSLEQWFNSRHYQNDISCNTCHQPHGLSDNHLLRTDDPQLCMDHHSKVKEEFDLKYKHNFVAASAEEQTAAAAGVRNPPGATGEVRQGMPAIEPSGIQGRPVKNKPPAIPKVKRCSACHSPHENFNTNAKSKVVRDVCVSCHTKYTGPFENPHKPAQQNCTACHLPHGSDNAGLCKTDPADLCTLCHSRKIVHPYYVYQQEPDLETFSQKCLKCHPMVHGSMYSMLRKYKPSGGPQIKGTSPRPQQGVQGPGGNL